MTFGLLLMGLCGLLRAEEVVVAVASNFAGPLKKLAAEFEKDTGHTVRPSFGSTGKFYAQIKNGAPFEVFLSADEETPAKLVAEKAAVAGTQYTYAIGKLVLWSPKRGVVGNSGDVLKRGGLEYLALANPKLAPYGAAAVETLKALGVYSALESKFVTGENITQTYQFVRSGNAQLGFVALSQVLVDGKIEGSYWLVPNNLYSSIRQDAVLLDKGRGKPAADALLKYLKGEKARALIKSFGYE
jgi:molybdate transport system substrate-binding protein